MNSLMIFLYVTNKCNRNCDHCYWVGSKKEPMSEQVISDVSEWVHNICSKEKVENLKVDFLGGEPLSEFDKIVSMMDLLGDQVHKQKKQPVMSVGGSGFVLSTNGDLLTPEILKELKARKVHILLNPTYNTLQEIKDKLLLVKSICGGCVLQVALNDFNLPRLADITKLAIDQECHIRTNRLYSGGIIPGYVDEYKVQMAQMFKLLLETKKPMWPNWIMENTYPIWEGPQNCYSCGKWLATIDSDGEIRSCNADPESVIGSIYTHKNWSDLKFLQRWSAKNLPECQGCEWITWCQGGCPYTRKLTYGDYMFRSPFCSAFKELFPKLMELTRRYKCER